MIKTILCSAIFTIAVALLSCEKDNEILSKTDMINGKTWKVTSKTVDPAIKFVTDAEGHTIQIFDIRLFDPDSVKNYGYKYSKDGIFTLLNDARRELMQTTWKFNSDESQITLGQPLIYNYPVVGNVSVQSVTIISISKDKIATTIPTVLNNVNHALTIIFEPK